MQPEREPESIENLNAEDRLKIAETRIAELIEKHVKQCLVCEKLDLATQIVELNGCLEKLQNLMEADRKTHLQIMNEWLGKYNIPYDCGWRNAIDKLIVGGTEAKQ